MKKLIPVIALAIFTNVQTNATRPFTKDPIVETQKANAAKLDIKIKNDSGDEVTVINAGSGGTYRLQKNVTTTIKMDDGDKLFTYESGKKGKLLLTAAAEMDGKVQLFSKL